MEDTKSLDFTGYSSTGFSLQSSTATLSLGFHWTLSCTLQHTGMLNPSSCTTHVIQDQTLSFGSCILIALSRKVLELLNALLLTNVVPHWVPKSVTNITLYCILFGYALQLAPGAFRLLPPGGDSSYPWVSVYALVHNLGK